MQIGSRFFIVAIAVILFIISIILFCTDTALEGTAMPVRRGDYGMVNGYLTFGLGLFFILMSIPFNRKKKKKK